MLSRIYCRAEGDIDKPAPCRWRVLEYPVGSADVRLNSNCHAFVSFRVLLDPPGAGNLCPGCAPARTSRDGRPATTSQWEVALQRQAVTLFGSLTLWAAVDSNPPTSAVAPPMRCAMRALALRKQAELSCSAE
jgi:hypothetical protein